MDEICGKILNWCFEWDNRELLLFALLLQYSFKSASAYRKWKIGDWPWTLQGHAHWTLENRLILKKVIVPNIAWGLKQVQSPRNT